ncbi:MAG: YciI family protein [Salinivirgaceae bacterium]|nr:YciI family protein [Salinivirgaceae bacterium]
MKKSFLAFLGLILIASQSFSQTNREFAMTEGDTTYIMKRYIFCLLMAGPERNQDSATVAAIQKGHMEHIQKMADSGKLVVAGPFEDGGNYRGILVFDVETTAEAMTIASEDPAVKSGRLKLEAIPWWAAKGTCLP